MFLLFLVSMSVTFILNFLFSLYKKAGIGKQKKPEIKYVVAKKGVGRFTVFWTWYSLQDLTLYKRNLCD